MSCKFIFIVALAFASFVSAARSVYTPGSFDNSKYSSSRSMSTDKWIIYWESGFGSDPTNASETYAVNMTRLKQVLDSCYDFNVQKLKMIDSTTSNAKNYKMIVFLDYTTTWEAYGSGVDNVTRSTSTMAAFFSLPSAMAASTRFLKSTNASATAAFKAVIAEAQFASEPTARN